MKSDQKELRKKYIDMIAQIDEIIKKTRRLQAVLIRCNAEEIAPIKKHPLRNSSILEELEAEQKNLHKKLKELQ